jgi:membrane-associated protease RseP (regulator of RpoE activity)
MTKKILIAICMVIFFAGCATIKPLNTTTGKPEIIITDTAKKDISDAIVNTMLSWDFQLQKRDDYILVFGKKNTNIASSVLLGSRYDAVPEWRFTYNLVDYADGVRIIANIAAVTNPGSAFERITDFSKGSQDAQNIQSFLENLKDTFGFNKTMKNRGKIGVMLSKNEIIKVLDNSPAERAGIMKGDIILKIDGEAITGDVKDTLLRVSGTPGSTVTLLLKRNGQELSIPVIRGNP